MPKFRTFSNAEFHLNTCFIGYKHDINHSCRYIVLFLNRQFIPLLHRSFQRLCVDRFTLTAHSLTVFAALSQLEREQLKQRQREGIEIAKVQGKYTGRKPIEIDWTRFGQLYGEWKSKNITERDFMRRMGLSANTFYRRVREYEATHGIAAPTSA